MKKLLLRKLTLAFKLFFISVCFINSAAAFAQVIVLPPIPVIKAPSTTTISSSANPSLIGQPVVLTATITSPAQGTPTGTVHFYDNATNTDLTPSGVTIINGKATFTTPILSANASFIATYSGDGANLASTSAAFSQTVNAPPIYIPPTDIPFYQTTTTLLSSANPSVAGSEPVTFTATVTGNNVTGLVEFWDNTNNINLTPAGVTLAEGVATFTTSSLPFGDLNITAIYRGDANGNQQSTSNSVIQHVMLNITGIGITLAADLSKVTSATTGTTNWGDKITFTATVSTGIGAPSGIVTFTDNGYLLGTVTMDGAGKASLTTNLLTPGNHNITASYLLKTSNVLTYDVIPPFPLMPFGSPGAGLVPSRVALIQNVGYNVISDNELMFFYGPRIPYGKPVTFGAFVSGLVGYTPTGNVLFQLIRDFEITDLGEVGLDAAGNALFTSSILPLGRNTIRIIYSGNDIYEPNVSSTVVEVEAAPTTTTISSNLNPSIAGQQITFTATVPPAFPEGNALPPQGDVTFIIDGINQSPAPLTGNFYKAFFDISSLTPGTHTIKAHYPGEAGGDANYKGSTSGTITQVVEKVGDAIFYFLGDSQSTPVNTAFPNSLMFNIININPKLVGGASVTYTAPSSGASGTFSNGTNTITIKTTPLGSVGVANSGLFTANGIAGTYTVTAHVPGFGTATFSMTNTAVLVPITVGTSVPGLSFSVDGVNYTTSQTFNWESGSSHTLATTSPQSLAVGNQYTFTGWSDGTNTLSRSITVPSSSTSYIAQFQCSQEWVLDKDSDDFYTGAPVVACQSPGEGYVLKADLNPGDCNDNDANINPQTIWLLDTDGDGYHEKIYIAQPSCSPPQDGRNYINNSKGQDCNDNDATYNPETVWVMDSDGDGYYIGDPYTGCFFIFTPGYVRKTNQHPGDCNDNDAAINVGTIWLLDVDGDGYHEKLYIALPSCAPPQDGRNYINNSKGQDCNDNDATYNPETVWVKDADGDGYYIGEPYTGCFLIFQPGYVQKTNQQPGDCDDGNVDIQAGTTWYLDADDDGYAASAVISCTIPGDGYTTIAIPLGDCNDANAEINPATVWYEDRDGDGYPGGDTETGCGRPKFYYDGIFSLTYTNGKLASELYGLILDCDDTNSQITPGTVWYKDADNDGFSDGTTEQACYQTTGYKRQGTVASGGDCDDTDADINPNTKWYPDIDNDNYSNGNYIVQCIRPGGYKLLRELTSLIGDCNDNNATLNPNTLWVKDADNDSYTDGAQLRQCVRPAGYKLPSEITGLVPDCNDANTAINLPTVWIVDTDGDGYYSGNSVTACTSPGAAYISKTNQLPGDCNNTDPTVNPGSVEVCGNGKDDNCNNVQNEQGCYTCGNATGFSTTNITGNSATLNWVSIPNPNYWQVQYKSTKPGSKWVDVKPDPTGNKRSLQIAGLSANQSYLWHIKAKCGNSWTDYSVSIGFKTASSVVLTRSAPTTAEPVNNISADNITVYPNPTNGIVNLNLQLKSMVTAATVISLTDITGRTIYKQKTDMVKGILNTKIQMPGNAAAGVYVMQAVVDGQSYQYRLVYVK